MELVSALRCRPRVHPGIVGRSCASALAFGMGSGGDRAGRLEGTAPLMGRTDSLAKLAWAYGLHLTRRRLSPTRPQVQRLLDTYGPDGLLPLTTAEQARHPQLVGCINCGLCALAAGRIGRTRPPDLAPAYHG